MLNRMPGSFRSSAAVALVATLAWTAPAWSKGSPVRFQATVVSISQTSETDATVVVRLQDFEVPIMVNGDTEIEMDGDIVGLAGLTVGAFFRVAGFFSEEGIVAESLDILDLNEGQFRLRGTITAAGPTTGGTLVTLLGVDVLVTGETDLGRRGSDDDMDAFDLAPGLLADVAGIFDEGQLVATRLKTGSRASEAIVVEFEGTIAEIVESTVLVDTGGGMATVHITDRTRVRGSLEVGAFVEVRGTLDTSLAVVAVSIKVDRDGDGDADDDHDGRRDDDDGDEDPVQRIRRGVPLLPTPDRDLEGEVETEFLETPGGPRIQEVEVAFRGATTNEAFTVVVTFASGTEVDFGEVRANGSGRVKTKFRTHGGGNTPSLTGLLPAGETSRDVARIDVFDGAGTLVMSAAF